VLGAFWEGLAVLGAFWEGLEVGGFLGGKGVFHEVESWTF
jgi:hypothetical protein